MLFGQPPQHLSGQPPPNQQIDQLWRGGGWLPAGRFDLFSIASNIVPLIVEFRPVREGVTTDSLKFHPGPPCPTLIRPAGGPPTKRHFGGVARPQGGRPPAVFFPLGYPFPYGPGGIQHKKRRRKAMLQQYGDRPFFKSPELKASGESHGHADHNNK
jgi:hypothetical protein